MMISQNANYDNSNLLVNIVCFKGMKSVLQIYAFLVNRNI